MTTLASPRTAAPTSADVSSLLRHELLALAKQHDEIAAAQSCRVPYWAPCPAEVSAHRAAAALLRGDAARLERQRQGR